MRATILLAFVSIAAIALATQATIIVRHPSDAEWQDYSSTAIKLPELALRPSPPQLANATIAHRSRRADTSQQSAIKTISYRRIIDLTPTLNDSVPLDVDAKSKPQPLRTIHTQTIAVDYYNKDTMVIAGGAGLHMDAPYHVYDQPARTIDEILAKEMTSPLVILDIREQALLNPDYQAQVSDLLAYEAEHRNGREIKRKSFVALRTGWSQFFYDEARYRNYGTDGLPHWPGFSAELAAFLINNRTIHGAGTDALSMDAGTNFWYSAHYTIAGGNKYMVENLDLSHPALPVAGATIVTARIKKQDAPEIWVSAFAYVL